MGQKIHPHGFRVGITEGWNSRWFAPKKLFGELLIEDQKIRKFVDEKLNRQPPYAAVARVDEAQPVGRRRPDPSMADLDRERARQCGGCSSSPSDWHGGRRRY